LNRTRSGRVAALALTVSLAATLGACSGGARADDGATPAKEIKQLDAGIAPSELQGLQVVREDQSETISRAERSYIDGVALFSLREGPLLQATLQVSRFNKDADYTSPGFRQSLLSQIGGSRPKAVRMGDKTVYLTSGTKQRISIWFEGRNLLILSTREEYPHPRSLLRQALEIKP
jgi:hypothetical protein